MLYGSSSTSSKQPLVTKDAIIAAYLQYLLSQHQSYFYAMPGAMPGDSALAFVEEDSLFDAEHVNGILRYLVGQRPHFAENVAIFPVFNPDAFYRVAQDLVVSRMLSLPKYQHLVKDKTPVLEEAECLGDEDLLAEREAELAFRDEQDNQANEIAGNILAEMGMNDNVMLHWHLNGIAKSLNSLVGNRTHPLQPFADCSQFVIPFRQDENHYTVAVVNCISDKNENGIANIQYYDSLGDELAEHEQTQLCDFFYDLKFDEVNFDCVSVHEQREGYNCGIFASFKAIDLLNANSNLDERLLPDLEKLHKSEYHELFHYFRNRIVEMLRESGCNIALSEDFAQILLDEQNARDQPPPTSILSNVVDVVTSFFWGKTTTDPVPTIGSVDPLNLDDDKTVRKTRIAQRDWNIPTAALLTNADDEEGTSHQHYKRQRRH